MSNPNTPPPSSPWADTLLILFTCLHGICIVIESPILAALVGLFYPWVQVGLSTLAMVTILVLLWYLPPGRMTFLLAMQLNVVFFTLAIINYIAPTLSLDTPLPLAAVGSSILLALSTSLLPFMSAILNCGGSTFPYSFGDIPSSVVIATLLGHLSTGLQDLAIGMVHFTKYLAEGVTHLAKYLAEGVINLTKYLAEGITHLMNGLMDLTKYLAAGIILVANSLKFLQDVVAQTEPEPSSSQLSNVENTHNSKHLSLQKTQDLC